MSDFLGRLAVRALGQVPPVRPRMPSRFEPAAGLVEEVVEAPAEERREGVESRAAREAPREPAVSAPVPPASRRLREDTTDATDGTDARVAGAEPVPGRSALKGRPLNRLGFQPQAGEGEPPSLMIPEEMAGEEVAGSPRPMPAPLAPAPLGLKPQAIQRPPLQGGTPPSSVEAIEETSSSSAGAAPPPTSPEPRDEHRGERDFPARRPLIPRAVLREEPPRPGITPRPGATPPSPHADAGPAAAAEPVIRVTIGRIEVRAAAPAPPAPAPRPAAARLTLEEYLRRRGEERM